MLISSSKAIMLFKKNFTLQDCAVVASFVLTAHCGYNPVVRVLNFLWSWHSLKFTLANCWW